MGMGIPIWIPIPMGMEWEWEYDFLLWGYPYGYPHGDSHRNPVRMGWESEWKFPSHANPAENRTIRIVLILLRLIEPTPKFHLTGECPKLFEDFGVRNKVEKCQFSDKFGRISG